MVLRSADGRYWTGRFEAMASPCELLLELDSQAEAERRLRLVEAEVRRIEAKFSRYRSGNITHRINHAEGHPIEVDEESARLLDYAERLYQLSDGLFDITSGVLRRVWRFEAGSHLPSASRVAECMQRVGWHKLRWEPPYLTLPVGMEIDLGGIGKEYAVDRCAQLLAAETSASFVINLGGDLFVNKPRADGSGWQIALDDPAATGERSLGVLTIKQGGVATSGDARRHLLANGRRYSHILDPRSGWPVEDAPSSVTVHAPSCMEAGMLATLAMLQGAGAEAFLQAQGLPYRLVEAPPPL